MIATWKPTSPAARVAYHRLQDARYGLTMARDLFEGFACDETAEGVRVAEDAYETACAVAAEWCVPGTPSLSEVG